MLGKIIYSVEGWDDGGTKDFEFLFDTEHEAKAFIAKAEPEYEGYEWFLEEHTLYVHSADALRDLAPYHFNQPENEGED